MRMPEEKVTNIRVWPNCLCKGQFVNQTNTIDTRQMDIERWVMHKQIHRLICMCGKGISKPCLSGFAIGAAGGTRHYGIQHDKYTCRCLHNVLNITVVVNGDLWKVLFEYIATVVIANNQVAREVESTKLISKQLVCLVFTTIG